MADEAFPSRGAEVFIAIMGPIWGLAFAMIVGLVYLATHNPIFAATASWMAMVNLFNLLPINPLDGGRIMKSIAYSVHSRAGLLCLIVGILVSGFLAFKVGFGLFVFLLIVGVIELVFEYRDRIKHPAMNSMTIIGSVIAYVSVACVLWGIMVYMSHIPGAAVAMELLQG